MYKNEFAKVLTETICLADGVLPPEFLNTGEIVTPLTLQSEQASEFYSGYSLNTNITQAELAPEGNGAPISTALVDSVTRLIQQAMALTTGLIEFKSRLLNDVLSCRALGDHVVREANHYLRLLNLFQFRRK